MSGCDLPKIMLIEHFCYEQCALCEDAYFIFAAEWANMRDMKIRNNRRMHSIESRVIDRKSLGGSCRDRPAAYPNST